jgi:kynurenine 3-monooxygenase
MGKTIEFNTPVIVLGAGLSGSLMALYLARRGFQVEVYERRVDMRLQKISAGKSINLAISVRGLHAMAEVGLGDAVRAMCIPMPGRMIHALDGSTALFPYSKDGQKAINSISRLTLNQLLMDAAEAMPGVRIHFQQRCVGMDIDTGRVQLQDEHDGRLYTVEGQTVICCDGAFSGGRSSMFRSPRFDYSQEFHSAAYKELTFPPAADGSWAVEKNALHIWPRGRFMLIALPNLDGSFTVTLFYPAQGPESFEQLDTAAKVEAFFRAQFPDALALMPELGTEFFENPTGDLVTVKCSPWVYRDRLALVGDAAHAVVPFYGQGMNAAFEDCTEMNACLEGATDWADVFARYNAARVANGHAIADLAIDNYIEMRDLSGDPAWQFRKKIEHVLEREFPERYVSRYELISFTRTPYAEALRRGQVNERILRRLAEGLDNIDHLDLELARQLVIDAL